MAGPDEIDCRYEYDADDLNGICQLNMGGTSTHTWIFDKDSGALSYLGAGSGRRHGSPRRADAIGQKLVETLQQH